MTVFAEGDVQLSVIAALTVMGLAALSGGALIALALTGGSFRCAIGGHERGDGIWTSRSVDAVCYGCPRCGVLWQPDNPFTSRSPNWLRRLLGRG